MLIAVIGVCSALQAQQYWQQIHTDLVQSQGKRYIFPERTKAFVLNTAALKTQLWSLSEKAEQGRIFSLPAPDGSFRDFKVWQSTMMEPALAAKYPQIKTFTAEATNDHRVTAKIDLSPAGFHAMIFDGEQTYFIDPYSDLEDGNYLCYYKKDCKRGASPSCSVLNAAQELIPDNVQPPTGSRLNGTQRRNYRLALACTYEYATAVGGATPTKASVLAQMVLIMNRVNGVYEREFSATMTLVANTDTLIYLTSTDPYTNNNGPSMLGQNITTLSTRIGNTNFDIGHVFSTGGGGVAYLGALCDNSSKAGGVTGLGSPFGDPFAIDYVAHEMGHQFGSDHTFNSNAGSCFDNAASNLAFEPGSGSTIMAYAGICGSDNLQLNSDAYFHAASLREIGTFITNAATGGSCPTTSATTNVPNSYPDFTQSYSIPLWTPFELTAPAVTDATADTLTYCWEEWDLGGLGQAWNANNNLMPFFRSFSPATSPTRVFPTMNNILAGTYSYRGERLPTAARTLKFVLTTRDIFQGWGCFNSSFDTDTVTLNAVATGDTFRVTSQPTATTWSTGSTQTITWNVAGTAAAPVNAANVNIYLSVDSGKTFPYILAGNVPNNGSASVVIPAIPANTNKARVKVKGANNVFFQINRSNITINGVPLPVTLSSFTASIKGCTVNLDWSVAAISKFSHFEVERSTDGASFEQIGTIVAHTAMAYSYADNSAGDGRYFYRLKMTDADGSFTYSSIINLRLSCNGSYNVMVFPNPAKDKITVKGNGNMLSAAIISTGGQVMKSIKMTGQNDGEITLQGLATGIYILQLTYTDNSRDYIKIVKE